MFGYVGHCVVPIFQVIREPVYNKISSKRLFFCNPCLRKKITNIGVVKLLKVLKMWQIARSEQQSPPSRNLRIRSLLGHSEDNIVSHAHREQGLPSPSARIQSSLTHSADNIVTAFLSILSFLHLRLQHWNFYEMTKYEANWSGSFFVKLKWNFSKSKVSRRFPNNNVVANTLSSRRPWPFAVTSKKLIRRN